MGPNALRRCVNAALLDSSVRIIAAEDLIAMKIFAGGTQDVEDLRGIFHVSGDRLEMNLLRNLALGSTERARQRLLTPSSTKSSSNLAILSSPRYLELSLPASPISLRKIGNIHRLPAKQ